MREIVYWTLQERGKDKGEMCRGLSKSGRITLGYEQRPLKRFDTEKLARERLQELLVEQSKGKRRGANHLQVTQWTTWR